MLVYKDIKGWLHYYANIYQSNYFEHDELINEAWIAIKDLTIPAFASAGIRWAMSSYKQKIYRQKHRGRKDSKIQSIDDSICDGLFLKDILAALIKGYVLDTDGVPALLNNPRLTLENRLLIDQRYVRNLTLNEIGKIYGVTGEAIRQRLNKLLTTLKYLAKQANITYE